jgi:hypothetical protein
MTSLLRQFTLMAIGCWLLACGIEKLSAQEVVQRDGNSAAPNPNSAADAPTQVVSATHWVTNPNRTRDAKHRHDPSQGS